MTYKIHTGDNRDILKTLADNSIDAIVTDPPYGIDFLGKSWDADTGALATYQECLRVLKPGGHILAFSAARTYHHLAVTLEQAGFEIRDQIMWIYSSGFPKSQDIGKSIERSEGKRKKLANANSSEIVGIGTQCPQCGKFENGSNQYKCQQEPCPLKEVLKPADNEWAGWGTALKPAHEPIALARKPLHKSNSIARNCQEWGTGAINIDATRVGDEEMIVRHLKKDDGQAFTHHGDGKKNWDSYEDVGTIDGRFPSNVLGEILQADYQKYFYCPKVSRQERHAGFELPPAMFGNVQGCYDENGERYAVGLDARTGPVGNNHPTVKPIELMKYLIKLITPPGGTVLDPFNGSGSTGVAAVELGFDYIGCELDPKYVEISKRRIEAWRNRGCDADVFDDLFTFGD